MTPDEVRRRIVDVVDANSEFIRGSLQGWYAFPGSPEGFLVFETNDALQLGLTLNALHDVMAFDVRPLQQLPVEPTLERWRGQAAATR